MSGPASDRGASGPGPGRPKPARYANYGAVNVRQIA